MGVTTPTTDGTGMAECPGDALRPPERPFGPRFISPILLGAALNPINSSVIATALVAIAAAMHVSVGQTAILISASISRALSHSPPPGAWLRSSARAGSSQPQS